MTRPSASLDIDPDFRHFTQWFRASSPYIREHRDKRFVVVVPQACLHHTQLGNIVRDLALLHVLGIKLTLVVETQHADRDQWIGQLNTMFARGLPSSRFRDRAIPLTEVCMYESMRTNSTEKPHETTEESTILADSLQQAMDGEAIVLVAPGTMTADIGEIAENVALNIRADKLILFHEPASLLHDAAEVNSDLSTQAFQALLDSQTFDDATTRRMNALLRACRMGVKRGHVVSYIADGALLAELFTADGSGTQISTDDYLTIRRATHADTDAVLELMQSDISEDRLVPRDRDLLQDGSTTIFIAEHDQVPVGCVALYSLTDGMQEIGTLLAAPRHRDRNIGARLLGRAESEARKRRASHVYVFTKYAIDWFKRHNYATVSLDALPSACRSAYDHNRQSTLLIKELA